MKLKDIFHYEEHQLPYKRCNKEDVRKNIRVCVLSVPDSIKYLFPVQTKLNSSFHAPEFHVIKHFSPRYFIRMNSSGLFFSIYAASFRETMRHQVNNIILRWQENRLS